MRSKGKVQDVAIVGASAAGLYTAYLLARGGARVRVLERAERLDPLPRTLIVTSRMRDLLGSLGDRAVTNTIRRYELYADGHMATVPLERPDLVIEHSTLIRSLAEQAEASGSRVSLGRRFVSLEAKGGGVALAVERGRG